MSSPSPKRAVSRRDALGSVGLSAAGLLALAGSATPTFARGRTRGNPHGDALLLTAAIALEHEGIAAYQIAAESGLLSSDVLKVGVLFQGHHKQHRDELVAAVRRLGGTPPEPKSMAEYAAAIKASSLKSQADILKLAVGLEFGAAMAYLGLVGPLQSDGSNVLVAKIAADEATHWTALNAALGGAIPERAMIFG